MVLRCCQLLVLFMLRRQWVGSSAPQSSGVCVTKTSWWVLASTINYLLCDCICLNLCHKCTLSSQEGALGWEGGTLMGSSSFWWAAWPWAGLCSCWRLFCFSAVEMMMITSGSHLSPWLWNDHRYFNLLKNCLYFGVFHGNFSDSNGLAAHDIGWMGFSNVSMIANQCMFCCWN